MKSFKIGKIKLANSLILAPMVDVTDLPYRLLCRRAGAALAFTEMIYIDALLHENKKTKNMAKTCEEDKPIGLQITGDRLEEFEKFVSEKELWEDYDLIDLNCGCPSLRVAEKSKAGSFLMNEPEKIAAIIKILKKTKKPVSVKLRLGFRDNNVLEVAKVVEKAGADAITVHARLAYEGNRDKAKWEWIKKVKEIVKIPVIGNGDVFSGEDALKMFQETGCDGVMIGRAAIGDPLIFSRIMRYLESMEKLSKESRSESLGDDKLTRGNDNNNFSFSDNKWGGGVGESSKDGIKENLRLFLEYLKLERKYYGDSVDLSRMKYVGSRFLKKMKGAAKMREEFHKLDRLRDVEDFISQVLH